MCVCIKHDSCHHIYMIYAITYTHTHMKTLGICVQLSLPKILKDVLHYVYIIYIYILYIYKMYA